MTMGRSPCCDKEGLKKGPWTPEEDQKLLSYVEEHGHGNWRALPSKAGLQRCGKSCRLRWTNYLRPDIKRGKFSLQEEQSIIQLHALLGNRWSAIATHLPKRTDNEIKNYWNTHLKKRLIKMGIDPVNHKPKNDALVTNGGQSKNTANLSHMAQWESARLEAEARLARQSKSQSNSFRTQLSSPAGCLDVPRAWPQGAPWPKTSNESTSDGARCSPTSTLSFSENGPAVPSGASTTVGGDESSATVIECMGNNEGMENALSYTSQLNDNRSNNPVGNFIEGFTELLLSNFSERSGSGGQYCEDSKNYWNNILNLVDSSPSSSSLF